MNGFDYEKFNRIINNNIGTFDRYSATFEAKIDGKYLKMVISDNQIDLYLYRSMKSDEYKELMYFNSYPIKYKTGINVNDVLNMFVSGLTPHISSYYIYNNSDLSETKLTITKINNTRVWSCQGRGKYKYTMKELIELVSECFIDDTTNSFEVNVSIGNSIGSSNRYGLDNEYDDDYIRKINLLINPPTVLPGVTYKQSMDDDGGVL